MKKWFRSDLIGRKVSWAQKVLQLCPRAQRNPMIGLGATAPFMKQYFSQKYCTQTLARAIAQFSGDGGPHRKPDRGSAVSFHPSFLLFLLLSLIRRLSACSLLRLHSFAPALFARFFLISSCSSMRLCLDSETDSECPPKYTSYYARPDFFSCFILPV